MARLTTKYNEENVPKEICTIDRFGEADDCSSCAEICEECNSDCENCAIQKCFNKLADYEDAEEQGLLLRLPIAIGSEVWKIITQRDNFTDIPYKIVSRVDFRLDMLPDLGKTVFLTREEAEKALADMGV